MTTEYNKRYHKVSILSDEIRDYLTININNPRGYESIAGSWDYVGEYIISLENFIERYPNSDKIDDVKTKYYFWLRDYFVGSLNSYPYDLSNDDLYFDESIDSYKSIIKKYKNSNTSNLVIDFFAVLEKNNFHCSDEVYDCAKSLIEPFKPKDSKY